MNFLQRNLFTKLRADNFGIKENIETSHIPVILLTFLPTKVKVRGASSSVIVPASISVEMKICRDTLMEAVAETSEDMMERYFNGETFSEAEIFCALFSASADRIY